MKNQGPYLCLLILHGYNGSFTNIHSDFFFFTHWGRVTHICVNKLTIIGSGNGLLPGRRQAIIWTNAGILLIGPLGTNFSEILIEIYTFSFKKMYLKMSSGKCRPFRLGLYVLIFFFNCYLDRLHQHNWLKKGKEKCYEPRVCFITSPLKAIQNYEKSRR